MFKKLLDATNKALATQKSESSENNNIQAYKLHIEYMATFWENNNNFLIVLNLSFSYILC